MHFSPLPFSFYCYRRLHKVYTRTEGYKGHSQTNFAQNSLTVTFFLFFFFFFFNCDAYHVISKLNILFCWVGEKRNFTGFLFC